MFTFLGAFDMGPLCIACFHACLHWYTYFKKILYTWDIAFFSYRFLPTPSFMLILFILSSLITKEYKIECISDLSLSLDLTY